MSDGQSVAVIGAGSIGVAFAVVFAATGWSVRITDPDERVRARVPESVGDRLRMLHGAGLMHDHPSVAAARVTAVPDVSAAATGAAVALECGPEQLTVKREIFGELARVAPTDALLCSSSSAIAPGRIAEPLPPEVAARVLVAHPANPPFLLPVIELVPSARTAPQVLDLARSVFSQTGLRPVTVRREVEGFLFNRLQGAVLREAYCLVRDGVATVQDIDDVVRLGLGRRWSIIGPFEGVDLNTQGGIASHALKMGPAYERMGAERGQHDPWTADLVAEVTAQRRTTLPLEDWSDRVAWRDAQLLAHTPLWNAALDARADEAPTGAPIADR
ncbi:3-hydroxyacyl-CoA dehydrogenase [Nakamurella leprariae]|uniref:3-hydroxyacyl-CoA dehydrogenase n=1 Tax=Nakamurella leprariae TaxID=2803911 RepID=A0A938YGL2_9ACTN|nr:3-hydroxyacyl-CoA dehydrogenase [Nakamurella leprariae]MBM9467435.1 3-hydroxyacyl-CoA dehydrogenase [Nakamurella leprariae]